MSKESQERIEEAFNKFIFSSEYNEQTPGYSGFIAGATWYKKQVLQLLQNQIDYCNKYQFFNLDPELLKKQIEEV